MGYGGAVKLSIHKIECAPPALALKSALVRVDKGRACFRAVTKVE